MDGAISQLEEQWKNNGQGKNAEEEKKCNLFPLRANRVTVWEHPIRCKQQKGNSWKKAKFMWSTAFVIFSDLGMTMSDIFMMVYGMKIQINFLCATLVAWLILGRPVRAFKYYWKQTDLEALWISPLFSPFALTISKGIEQKNAYVLLKFHSTLLIKFFKSVS